MSSVEQRNIEALNAALELEKARINGLCMRVGSQDRQILMLSQRLNELEKERARELLERVGSGPTDNGDNG